MQERLEKSINVKLTEVDNYCDYIIKYPFSYKIHTEVSRGKELWCMWFTLKWKKCICMYICVVWIEKAWAQNGAKCYIMACSEKWIHECFLNYS